MNPFFRHALAVLPFLAVCGVAADTTGCAGVASSTGCTATPFISPTSVTLDHAATGAANSQAFSTGTKYSGSCAISAIAIKYYWNVSDTIDATVNTDGSVSCVNSSAAPITVYSSIISYTGSGSTLTQQNVPTDLPTATLTCK